MKLEQHDFLQALVALHDRHAMVAGRLASSVPTGSESSRMASALVADIEAARSLLAKWIAADPVE